MTVFSLKKQGRFSRPRFMVAQIKGWDISFPRNVPPNLRPGRTQLSTLHAEATSCVGFGEGLNAGEELVHGAKSDNLTYLTPKQAKYQFASGWLL